MKTWVKVVPCSKSESIAEKSGLLEVRVKEPAEQNKANYAVLRLLEKHFNADIRLIKGATSRKKLIEITER
ncbi:DUF167 domain-containing protein [Candidatus Micrarchaeota archaeon]|jgi:uncharacterized protein (TIGR00251 family)|nr:DUF167 domain-containing protein [Candidatus Micrarchaeota archaeon]